MKKMKKYSIVSEKGITLIGLIVIVVIMLILAGVSINSGAESLNNTRLKGFYTQLEIVQKRVDDITATNEKYLNESGEEIYIKEAGQHLTQTQEEKIEEIFIIEEIATTNIVIDNFRYFTIQDIQEFLDLQEIEYDLFIDFENRIIIAEDGITIDGRTYYALKNTTYFAETNTSKNVGTIESLIYSDPIKYSVDTYKVTITPDNIIGDLDGTGVVKYKKTITKYWETSNNNEIIIQKDVEYNIKYIDTNNNSIEKIIKIDYKKDEEGNFMEDEEGNNMLTVVEILHEQESEEI